MCTRAHIPGPLDVLLNAAFSLPFQEPGLVDRDVQLEFLPSVSRKVARLLFGGRGSRWLHHGIQYASHLACGRCCECMSDARVVMGKAEGRGEDWHGHVTAVTVAPEYRRLGLAEHFMSFLEEVSEKKYAFISFFTLAADDADANGRAGTMATLWISLCACPTPWRTICTPSLATRYIDECSSTIRATNQKMPLVRRIANVVHRR